MRNQLSLERNQFSVDFDDLRAYLADPEGYSGMVGVTKQSMILCVDKLELRIAELVGKPDNPVVDAPMDQKALLTADEANQKMREGHTIAWHGGIWAYKLDAEGKLITKTRTGAYEFSERYVAWGVDKSMPYIYDILNDVQIFYMLYDDASDDGLDLPEEYRRKTT